MVLEFTGKATTCKVFVHDDKLEQGCIDQVKTILDSPAFEDKKIRFMPDIHQGIGVPIGFTAELGNKIIPNVVGVDIGCGVTIMSLGNIMLTDNDLSELDKFIRKNIPSGMKVRDKSEFELVDHINNYLYSHGSDRCSSHEVEIKETDEKIEVDTEKRKKGGKSKVKRNTSAKVDNDFVSDVERICKITKQDSCRAFQSLGTLGGGNHWESIDQDEITGEKYVTIHSGSRGFGLKIAKFYQDLAMKHCNKKSSELADKKMQIIKNSEDKKSIGEKLAALRKQNDRNDGPDLKVQRGLEYLEGADYDAYVDAMKVAQRYARINRHMMGYFIMKHFGIKFGKTEIIESIHNYINFEDGIIRKGAISAREGEKLVIPLNMRDGVIIGVGKGNADWNNSAPHGAGRVHSRRSAKDNISMDAYRESMRGIWSSCVNPDTLDESPFAYKDSSEIIEACKPSVDVIKVIKPIYNFKASE